MVQLFFQRFFNKPEKKRVSAYVIQVAKIEARKQILFYVRGEIYSIYAKCPDCGRRSGEIEVLKQFQKNPDKFSVFFTCVYCGCSVVRPKIKVDNTEVNYLSPFVTSVSLTDKMLCLCPSAIRRLHPSIYYSAAFNFGSLKNAFSKIRRRKYKKAEIRDWEKRISSLAKKYPNRLVSQVFGVSEEDIEKIRG